MLHIEDLSRSKGFRFLMSVIGYGVWAYHWFGLRLRDVKDLLAERGVTRFPRDNPRRGEPLRPRVRRQDPA